MNCAVMGILSPGIYLGTGYGGHDLSLGVSRNVSIFQRPEPKFITAVFKCSLQTSNVVRDKLYGERMCTHFVYEEQKNVRTSVRKRSISIVKFKNEPERKTIAILNNKPGQLRRQSAGLLILRSRVQVPYRAAIILILVSIGRFSSFIIKLMSFEIIHHGIAMGRIHRCSQTTRVLRVFLYVPWMQGKCEPKGSTFGYRSLNIHK